MARIPFYFRFATLFALGLFVATPAVNAQAQLAIKGGRILPISGKPIDGGVILIREGKILAVGKDLPIPTGAKVIDATGKVIMPGFIEAHSSRGMDQTNERNSNIPFASVVDAIDPSQEYFEECRRNGVTTVCIVPGHNTMIGGQAAVIKTAGDFVEQMIVKRHAGIKLSLEPTGERSRMSHLASLRQELVAARDFLEEEKAKSATSRTDTPGKPEGAPGEAQPRPRQRPGTTPGGQSSQVDARIKQEALAQLLKGEMPAFIYCDAAMDVPQALRLTQEYKLKPILVLGQNCYKAAREVAASKLPVILEPTLVFWESDPRTGEDRKIVLPKIYREAKVPVMFQTTGISGGSLFSTPTLPPTLGTNYLWYQVATAVKYGMPVEEALEALTLRPSRLLGIEKIAGSIEPGKDADLVILTGDPLKIDTWVDQTLIRGKVVYDRSKDDKLQELLQSSPKSARGQ